jgi:phosphinothricin acetyltransferase
VADVVVADSSHLDAIAAIYAEAAETSYATFDLAGRPPSFWEAALTPEIDGHTMLVALDGGGAVLGYAKSGRHKDRAAYDTTCETSVYLAASARGRGVGRALYDALLSRLEASPLLLAVAGVALPNEASVRLHRSCGFVDVGTFHDVGVKFGVKRDVLWFERSLAVDGQ